MARSNKSKLADEQVRLYYDGSFYALYREYKESIEFPLSWASFMRSKPYWIKSAHKVVSCICIHHRSMHIRAKALAKIRTTLHKDPKRKRKKVGYLHESSCNCQCGVCTADDTAGNLADFKDTVMCPRKNSRRHYNVACVLGKCKDCGFDRRVRCCPIEQGRGAKRISAKVLGKVEVDTPKGPKKVAAEVTQDQLFGTFMDETAKEVKDFLEHDFVSTWQGDLYHNMLFDTESLPYGTELWVSDYIENFSTFSSLELQQDYYNKTQVAIFITLVIRHREPGEAVLPSEVTL